MIKLNKVIAVLLAGSILMTSCGKTEGNKGNTEPDTAQSDTMQPDTAPPEKAKTELPETAPPEPTSGTFSASEPYNDANHEVSILGFKEYKKVKGEKYTDKPQKGNKYLVLFLKLHNGSTEKDYFHADYLSAKLDGKEIENTFLLNDPEGYSSIFTNVGADATIAGFIVWEVPADWEKMDIQYTGWQGKDGLSLKCSLTKKDISEPEPLN